MVAGIRMTFDASGPLAALAQAKAAGQDLRPALRSIARAGVTQTKLRFITKRGPDGSTWKPSRDNPNTLILKSYLRDSITDRPPEANAVEWGSNRVYAGVHQDGATIEPKAPGGRLRFQIAGKWVFARKVTIPPRPYLGVNAEDMAEFAEIALDHLGAPLGAG